MAEAVGAKVAAEALSKFVGKATNVAKDFGASLVQDVGAVASWMTEAVKEGLEQHQ